MNVDRIRREDVSRVLTPIWSSKPETARRVRQRIRAVLGWAWAHDYVFENVAGEGIDGALPTLPAVKDGRSATDRTSGKNEESRRKRGGGSASGPPPSSLLTRVRRDLRVRLRSLKHQGLVPKLAMVSGPLVTVCGPSVTVFEATDNGFWSAARAIRSGGISHSAGSRVHSFASASRCASTNRADALTNSPVSPFRVAPIAGWTSARSGTSRGTPTPRRPAFTTVAATRCGAWGARALHVPFQAPYWTAGTLNRRSYLFTGPPRAGPLPLRSFRRFSFSFGNGLRKLAGAPSETAC